MPLREDNIHYLYESCHVVGVHHIPDYEQWSLYTRQSIMAIVFPETDLFVVHLVFSKNKP